MSRTYVTITSEELKQIIEKQLYDYEEDCGFGFNPYKLPSKLEQDLAKVDFDWENYDIGDGNGDEFGSPDLVGYQSIDDLNFLGVMAGGDWQTPVYFIIYWDGSKLRGYIPTEGNFWNTDTHEAYGSDNMDDTLANFSKRFPTLDPNDLFSTNLVNDVAAILADIKQRIQKNRSLI